MKTFLSIMIVLTTGFLGLGLVFSDSIPIPVGLSRVAFGAGFYAVVGFILAKWNSGRLRLRWAITAGWGLGLLGIVGLGISIRDPHYGNLSLALLFLFGPAVAAIMGGWLGRNR